MYIAFYHWFDMAKSTERNNALLLRKQGKSIKEIAQRVGVSKSSASLWCRDIELTPQQVEALDKKMLYGSYRGRIIAAQLKKQEKSARVTKMKEDGCSLLGIVTPRDLFLLGLGLYWGEGTKNGAVKFTNSNPILIRLFMKWMENTWGVSKNHLTFLILINVKHRSRLSEVLKYWSHVLRVPRSQFINSVLIKAKTQKNYTNFPKYYGTIQVRAKKSTNLLYKIQGALEKVGEATAR